MVENRLTFSGLWADTRASFAANSGIYLTLGAAFIFLPQLLLSLVQPDPAAAAAARATASPLFLAVVLLVLLAQFFAIVPITRTVLGGGGETVGQLLAAAASRLPTLLGVLGLFMVLAFALALALLIPLGLMAGSATKGLQGMNPRTVGLVVLALLPVLLWINARLIALMPTIAAENLGPIASIRRAWGLTRGHGARLVGYLVLISLIIVLVAILAGALGGALGVAVTAAGSGGLGTFLVQILSAAAGTVFGVLFAIFAAHIYRRLAA